MINLISAMSTTSILVIVTLCLLPAFLYTIIAGIRVQTVFAKYNRLDSLSGLTAEQACKRILQSAGLEHVQVTGTRGNLTDHYDPTSNTIYLSETTRYSKSVGAIGVAAHEAGHAIQYAEEYKPIKLRAAMVPMVSFTSKLIFPLMLLTMVVELVLPTGNLVGDILLGLLIGVYGAYMLFTLATLPVEYNASSRAKKILRESGILNDQECGACAKVLGAAAQTYLASFVYSFVQFFRLLLILLSRRNRD